MDTETVSRFLGLLAVVAQLATLTGLVLAVGARFSTGLADLRDRAVAAEGANQFDFDLASK